MTRIRTLAGLLAVLLSFGALTACENTWEGMGQDAEDAGDAVEDSTDDL